MNLSQILAIKGPAVVTAPPHRTLGEAVTLLSEKRIGAVVIASSDGTLLGILSERDIIRALAEFGPPALDAAASRFMTEKLVTATGAMSVDEAMDRMTQGRFRHMPVIENGRLCGLISIGDVVKHRLESIENEKRSMLDYIATA